MSKSKLDRDKVRRLYQEYLERNLEYTGEVLEEFETRQDRIPRVIEVLDIDYEFYDKPFTDVRIDLRFPLPKIRKSLEGHVNSCKASFKR